MLMVNELKTAASQCERAAAMTSNHEERVGNGGKDGEKRQEKALDLDAKRRAALDAFQKGLEKKAC